MASSHLTSQGGIYQIRCLVNGKVYVGSTVWIDRRWKEHFRLLTRGVHHSRHLQRSWLEFGSNSFVFEILELASADDLIRIEQEYLDRIRPFDPRIGFNYSRTAMSSSGYSLSDQTRARMSAARLGREFSVETRAKLSAAKKGRLVSAETRAKISASGMGQSPSVETRAKLSKANKGRMLSELHRAKISAALRGKGRAMSAEIRAKISATMKSKDRRNASRQEVAG